MSILRMTFVPGLVIFVITSTMGACSGNSQPQEIDGQAPDLEPEVSVPDMIEMGGAKSVTTFFVTSVGPGEGGNLGGLEGADAHCQALATAEYAGDHTWRAYLSTTATVTDPAVNARDRIGDGPWYNAEALLIAANVEALHNGGDNIGKERATTERLDMVNGVGDTPNRHDILTGSRPDGRAFDASEDRTCNNWTSSGEGQAQVGHHDRTGRGEGINSWNSEHPSAGCSQDSLEGTGGAGLFYCFAID
ncbi:MAG: hypothetical protein CL484_15350 [Acidobacteria bacterium]|nr:hypothetical protein [Acidobacteriota bacterium]